MTLDEFTASSGGSNPSIANKAEQRVISTNDPRDKWLYRQRGPPITAITTSSSTNVLMEWTPKNDEGKTEGRQKSLKAGLVNEYR